MRAIFSYLLLVVAFGYIGWLFGPPYFDWPVITYALIALIGLSLLYDWWRHRNDLAS